MEVFIFSPARNDTFISNMPLHHSMGSRTAGIWICCLVKHHDIIPLLANCDIDKRALCLRLRICFYHGFIFFLKLKAFCQESLLATRLTVKAPWLIGDGYERAKQRQSGALVRSGYPAAWFCPTGRSTLWHHQPIPTHLGSDELQLKGSLGVICHSSWGADRKCLVFLLYVELLKLPSIFVSRSVSVRIDDLPLLCSGSHCFQGLLGEDQGRLWLLPHGAEITLALIRQDVGRECLGEFWVGRWA